MKYALLSEFADERKKNTEALYPLWFTSDAFIYLVNIF